MIEKDNFRKLLVQIGFTKKGEVYEKKISNAATILKVDFKKQELIYPEDKGLLVKERQTCNLSANENFQPYHDRFDKGSELANLCKQKKFKALRKTEQRAEIARRYLAYVQAVERDKLYHFVMASAGDIVNTGIPLKQVGEEMQRRKAEVFKKYL